MHPWEIKGCDEHDALNEFPVKDLACVGTGKN